MYHEQTNVTNTTVATGTNGGNKRLAGPGHGNSEHFTPTGGALTPNADPSPPLPSLFCTRLSHRHIAPSTRYILFHCELSRCIRSTSIETAERHFLSIARRDGNRKTKVKNGRVAQLLLSWRGQDYLTLAVLCIVAAIVGHGVRPHCRPPPSAGRARP